MTDSNQEQLVKIDSSKPLEIENARITSGSRIKNLEKQTQYLYVVITGITIALLLGFAAVIFTLAGVMTDLWRHNADSYIDYQNSQKENTEVIEELNKQIKEFKLQLDQLNKPTSPVNQ